MEAETKVVTIGKRNDVPGKYGGGLAGNWRKSVDMRLRSYLVREKANSR